MCVRVHVNGCVHDVAVFRCSTSRLKARREAQRDPVALQNMAAREVLTELVGIRGVSKSALAKILDSMQ